jgi:hypothetical protein
MDDDWESWHVPTLKSTFLEPTAVSRARERAQHVLSEERKYRESMQARLAARARMEEMKIEVSTVRQEPEPERMRGRNVTKRMSSDIGVDLAEDSSSIGDTSIGKVLDL